MLTFRKIYLIQGDLCYTRVCAHTHTRVPALAQDKLLPDLVAIKTTTSLAPCPSNELVSQVQPGSSSRPSGAHKCACGQLRRWLGAGWSKGPPLGTLARGELELTAVVVAVMFVLRGSESMPGLLTPRPRTTTRSLLFYFTGQSKSKGLPGFTDGDIIWCLAAVTVRGYWRRGKTVVILQSNTVHFPWLFPGTPVPQKNHRDDRK